MRRFVLFFLLFMPAFAMAGPDNDARSQLDSTMQAIKTTNERQKELDEQQSKLERELSFLREQTVGLARESGDLEQALSGTEEKLAILEEQKKTKEKELTERRSELSALISAMIKLQGLPPAAVIAMPGKLDETFATARALSVVTHTIEEDAESLKSQLAEISKLTEKIEKNRDIILARNSELEVKHTALSRKIKERGAVQAKLGMESEQEKAELASLEARSKNLGDLVDALGRHMQEARAERERTMSARHVHHASHDMRSFATARGRLQAPVTGKVVRHYSESSDESAFSRGIVIEARGRASVVAPFDGEVVYAGNFRDYGRIVIIRHTDDYHTLLSGMEHIDCTPGEFLMKGEPVGSMGEGKDARRLYMEVRKGGKPVDPLPWLRPVS
jgi:septal ring factor EnvC (AmiA/AmiB activator)